MAIVKKWSISLKFSDGQITFKKQTKNSLLKILKTMVLEGDCNIATISFDEKSSVTVKEFAQASICSQCEHCKLKKNDQA